MSREVDPNSKSLSEDDKRYLAERGQLSTKVLSVEEQRKLLDPTQDALSLEDRANTGDMNTVAITKEEFEELQKLRAEAEVKDGRELFGSQSGPAPDEDDDEDDVLEPPYDQYTKGQLFNEVERRNADRDDDEKIEVEAPQNKPEYVAALTEDDEE